MNISRDYEIKKMTGKKAALIAALVIGIFAIIYVVGGIFFQSHYLPRTVINGVSCTGKTAKSVQEDIREEVKNYKLELKQRGDKSETIRGDDVSIAVEFDDTLDKILDKQNGFKWIVTLFKPEVYESKSIVSYDKTALKKQMQQLKCMDTKGMVAPEDATLEEDQKEDYVIVPEVMGTTIDEKVFWKELNSSVLNLQDKLDMDKKCYVDPKVRKDSKVLKETLAQMKGLKKIQITYSFGDKKEILKGDEICKWMSISEGKAVVNEEQATEFIKSLGSKYNTAYKSKKLKTSWGSTVTITGGAYGWKIDNAKELEQLKKDIADGKDVTRDPVYSQTANSHGENDYGNTYVEINLTAQHLYFYKDGNLIVDSDFVSGNISKGNGTPVGAYPVTYTQRDATLKGENYASDVNFWIPYCGNVGMHDASWRNSFGGSIYKTSGSHGCVNLPYDAAKKIFDNIAAGYPVLVYELAGTESAKSIAMDQGRAVTNAINGIGEVTLDSQGVIASCRAQYDALSDEAKSYVDNYDVLLAAEEAYANLVNQQAAEDQANAEAQAQANAVIDLINKIGAVGPDSGGAIQSARAAYDALSDRAKGFVTNYGVLTQAEAEYQQLSES
ncbi:MAG: L,D-transpeptidase family protein [Lachnospiraceae bacterium]|nr:L,D-transpeptidase family protein [Lachnospiraceae bacterium]